MNNPTLEQLKDMFAKNEHIIEIGYMTGIVRIDKRTGEIIK